MPLDSKFNGMTKCTNNRKTNNAKSLRRAGSTGVGKKLHNDWDEFAMEIATML